MITLGTSSQRSPTYAALKASIILFDIAPGTRTFTVPEGVSKIRAFVVGAGGSAAPVSGAYNKSNPGGGGGYAEKTIEVSPGQTFTYTVGDAVGYTAAQQLSGETSSFGGLISATGGKNAHTDAAGTNQSGGKGLGGDVNASGGVGTSGSSFGAGAGSRFGDGNSSAQRGGFARCGDGWGIGDFAGGRTSLGSKNSPPRMGAGGTPSASSVFHLYPLVGGGAGVGANDTGMLGGVGAVGVEVLA